MTDPQTCSQCGAALPADSSLGACPRCLLAAGLDGASSAGSAGTGTPFEAPAPADIAEHFPLFEILEVIGQGGMGVVYKARQVSLDRLVALKIMPDSISSDPAFADRSAREAKTMARLDHPSIVRIHEFGEAGGLYFLVMEYVDGANLRQVMETGGLEPDEALRIVPQVCVALQYAHDHGVVHRDIEPENVLIDRDGRVKITDFGLAKLVNRAPNDHTITRVGQVMGTPQYMAPEQLKTPQDVDHRADIYSLGVVFYEMLTGDVPRGRFAPPSERVQVDVRLDDVVLRTLESERERRYQRVDDVRTEVTSIAEAPALASAGAPRAVEPPPAPTERRLSRLALVGFLCLPAIFVVPAIAVVVARLFGAGDVSIAVAMLLALALLVLGFCLSLAGWIQVARSRGTLSGMGLAIAGTLVPVPLLFLGLGATLFLFTSVREEDMAQQMAMAEQMATAELTRMEAWETSSSPSIVAPPLLEGVPALAPTPSVAPPPDVVDDSAGPTLVGLPPDMVGDEEIAETVEIEALFADLQRLGRGDGAVTPADLTKLVAPVDLHRIQMCRPADLERLRGQELLGLVLPTSSVRASSLGVYRITEIDFTGPTHERSPFVTVTAAWNDQAIRFDITWNGSEWTFAVSPVRRGPPDSIAEADLIRGGPTDWDLPSKRRAQTEVEMLWSIYQSCWEGPDRSLAERIPGDHLRWMFDPRNYDEVMKLSGAGRVAHGEDGSMGLPFFDAATLPRPISEYRLTAIELLPEGRSGRAIAEAGDARLSFDVTWDAGRWWLGAGPVEVGR